MLRYEASFCRYERCDHRRHHIDGVEQLIRAIRPTSGSACRRFWTSSPTHWSIGHSTPTRWRATRCTRLAAAELTYVAHQYDLLAQT
ncbi:hypothetical protein BRC91_05290 [Halobacteriales archaeon QS_4_62_28]|nr:MAG: hypothetical protein BRC91_05290 [Halobacteriales archaeon QS_4_62_28]